MKNIYAKNPLIKDKQDIDLNNHSHSIQQIFHLSLSAINISEIRNFYELNFDCKVRRINKNGQGVHVDFFGHQLTFVEISPEQHHQRNKQNKLSSSFIKFGTTLPYYLWFSLKRRLERNNINFCIKPRLKFEGEQDENHVIFVKDPSENTIEIKSFAQTHDWL